MHQPKNAALNQLLKIICKQADLTLARAISIKEQILIEVLKTIIWGKFRKIIHKIVWQKFGIATF